MASNTSTGYIFGWENTVIYFVYIGEQPITFNVTWVGDFLEPVQGNNLLVMYGAYFAAYRIGD